MGWEPAFNNAWNAASDSGQAMAQKAATRAESAWNYVGRGYDWTKDQANKGYEFGKEKVNQTVDYGVKEVDKKIQERVKESKERVYVFANNLATRTGIAVDIVRIGFSVAKSIFSDAPAGSVIQACPLKKGIPVGSNDAGTGQDGWIMVPQG